MQIDEEDVKFETEVEQFRVHTKIFHDLTKRTKIDTRYDIISIIITYDSKNCMVIAINNDT